MIIRKLYAWKNDAKILEGKTWHQIETQDNQYIQTQTPNKDSSLQQQKSKTNKYSWRQLNCSQGAMAQGFLQCERYQHAIAGNLEIPPYSPQ